MEQDAEDHFVSYEQIIGRFVTWAADDLHIRAAMIVGSQARMDHLADEWSDLDVVVLTTDPALLFENERWLDHIGTPVITFVETTVVGAWQERRALVDDAPWTLPSSRQP